jgi:hypothetical protein
VNGIRLGVAFQRKLRVGGGVSWLKTELGSRQLIVNDAGEEQSVIKYPKFVYFCLYADFVFYKTKRWQLSVPIQIGTGYGWSQNDRGYDLASKSPKYFLALYEPGITVQFKVFKWFGLGADVAYRFAANHRKKTDVNLNSPTYSFKLLFWFDQLYFDLFPNSDLTKKYGPAYW